jgi:hypothetical protein
MANKLELRQQHNQMIILNDAFQTKGVPNLISMKSKCNIQILTTFSFFCVSMLKVFF